MKLIGIRFDNELYTLGDIDRIKHKYGFTFNNIFI